MNNEKMQRKVMWVLVFVTMALALFSYYGNISPVVAGICGVITMTLLEMTVMENDQITHGNNKFGRSYMDGLAISLLAISMLMCFKSVLMDLIWIVIVIGGGYLIARLFMNKKGTASHSAQA